MVEARLFGPSVVQWGREQTMSKPSNRIVVFLAVIGGLALILFSSYRLKHPDRTDGNLPTGPGKPAVRIGENHGVSLASDGNLWTWGESGFGWRVLGLGSNVRTQAFLRRIGRETNWVNIAVGGSTTLALKSDGILWGWGENIYGQLGDGTRVPERPAPVRSVPGNEQGD